MAFLCNCHLDTFQCFEWAIFVIFLMLDPCQLLPLKNGPLPSFLSNLIGRISNALEVANN